MIVAPGTRLGPYEIVSPLGAGGMGEVYRARDPRMGREVAIKVAAERFTDRFEREVRAIAALNHPHICHVYDVGPNYLVMELVEGTTLKDRMQAGALSLDEALAIARQIGDALEAAHEKGIVHRDLKPANIKLKADGTVKVLDFGLAKIAEPQAASGSPEESPTVAMSATIAGQIMGTAAYMAPEQARGQAVDKRADIWAFGVVLCEMVTGRRLFTGETVSDTLSAVLTKEPDWNRVPARVRPLVRRCLERDLKWRLRDIGDAWLLLDAAPPSRSAGTRIAWATAGLFTIAAGIALWIAWRTPRPLETTAESAARLDLDLGPDVRLGSTAGPAVIVSPDGNRIVFVSQSGDGTPRLFSRTLDDARTLQLPGTEGAYAPFFSPDGQWVGFFGLGKLKKIRLDGGEPVSLCEAPAGRGASWGEDGNIIAALDKQSGLSQVSAQEGKVTPVTELRTDIGEFSHRWPQILPQGKSVLFTPSVTYSTFDDAAVAVVSLEDHSIKTVLQHAGMYPRYLPTGHLIYVRKGSLFAVRFDLERLEARGPATLLLEEVASNRNIDDAQIDFSRTGIFLYRASAAGGLRTMQWLDSSGNTAPLGIEPASYMFPRLSPDGSRLAYILNQGADAELWIYDRQRGSKTRLSAGQNAYPVWSPDSRFVVFQAAGGMFWSRSDAAGKPQPLTQSKGLQLPSSFTPDGKQLVFGQLTSGAGPEMRTLSVESASGQLKAGQSRLLLKTSSIENYGAVSPDGHWLAYVSAEGGTYEVYVRAFPDNGAQVQVSNAGGVLPVWSRIERELFYRTEDQRLMAVKYRVEGGSFVPDKPRMWSGRQLANVGLAVNFDLSADGKRFITLMSADTPEPLESQSHVKIATGFFGEVTRRAAARRK